MLSIASINIKLADINLGPSITCIGQLGRGDEKIPGNQVAELVVPWQKILPDPNLFSLLSWHTRISEFAGRDREMARLVKWAKSNHPIRINFVVGEGGAGKSRLAAEFAEKMQGENWSAGFINLRKPINFPMSDAGTLLIVDYPEEYVDRVKELLGDLAHLGPNCQLRVLFLTRQSPERWADIITSANANNLVDSNYITLNRLDAQDAKIIYNTTACKAGETLGHTSQSDPGHALIPSDAMDAWMKIAPENHRSLFIMAAAVHSAENPDDEIVNFSGRQIVTSLVEREINRVIRIAESRKLKDKYALARLMAMAAIAGELTLSEIESYILDNNALFGFNTDGDIKEELISTGLFTGDKLLAPTPDIVAAALTVNILAQRPEHAPDLIWAALQNDLEGGLERIGRLCYDAEIVLGMREHSLSDWLAQKIDGDFDKCKMLDDIITEDILSMFLYKIGAVINRTLIKYTKKDEDKSRYYNNLSYYLGALGDTAGALTAIREAVEIYCRLSESNPAKYEPDLAMSLNNLSKYLSEAGDTKEALAAIREAVKIRRRLSESNPARYKPDLAMSLNNLSSNLFADGDTSGALTAIREAVEINRRLSESNSARYEPELAMNLNNLSNRLSEDGDAAGALTAIREAVEIRRRLSESNPARYKPDLAMSLYNLSSDLSDSGDTAGALDAIREAVEIRRRLSELNPARYEPELAASLNNLSNRLSEDGDAAGALTAIREAVEIRRRLSESNPARYEPYLAMSLFNLSSYLSAQGDTEGALTAICEAVKIRRRLSELNSARYEPDLAHSLGLNGLILSSQREYSKAISLLNEGIELLRPHVEKYPEGPHAKLLATMESVLKDTLNKYNSGE
ncbi:MAG: tetratricopeptide repeat protein [candidate division Zixibacteria bacterium]